MKVSINSMYSYYTKLVAFFCICLLKTTASKISLCTFHLSLLVASPKKLQYIEDYLLSFGTY